MGRFEHKLPAVLEPVGDICLQLSIPAHPDYVALFIRAVRMLETNRLYERDENLSAKIVTQQWRDRTITPMIEALASATGNCQDLDGECLTYPPFAGFISYSPQNPFTEPDLVPEGFEQPPFFVNGKDNAHDLPNYNKGDVILDFGSINIEPSWDLAKTPRIELCLTGSGVVEIHLLKIVQGGAAVISVDNPVDLGDLIGGLIGEGIEIIQLNQDTTSLPPETAEEVIIELEIATEGDHVVYIYYLPVVNDSLIPLGFGGGLREISLCGNLRPCGTPPPEPPPPLEGVTELKSEFQFTNDCGLEYRYRDQDDNIISDWIPVAGWVDNAALCFGGGMSIDYEAMKAAMCEAIECGAERVAARYLSGTVENLAGGDIVIGPGATPVVVPPGQAPDDPETSSDEESRSGGAQGVYIGFRKLILDIHAYIITQGLSEADTYKRISAKYQTNDSMEQAIIDYGAELLTPPVDFTTPVITADLASYIYCEGNSLGSISAYVIDTWDAEVNSLLGIVNGLEKRQLDDWYNSGILVPSTDYLAFSCVKTEPYDFIIIANPQIYYDTHTLKKNHRYEITSEGYWEDAAGNIQDTWWTKNTGVAENFSTSLFNIAAAGSPKIYPTIFECPFSPTLHKYRWTLDVGPNNVTIVWNWGYWGGFTGAISSPTGGISISVKDLGEYT